MPPRTGPRREPHDLPGIPGLGPEQTPDARAGIRTDVPPPGDTPQGPAHGTPQVTPQDRLDGMREWIMGCTSNVHPAGEGGIARRSQSHSGFGQTRGAGWVTAAPFTEDELVQRTTAEYLEERLGWRSVLAYNQEDFGPDSLLGRRSDRDVVLVRPPSRSASGEDLMIGSSGTPRQS